MKPTVTIRTEIGQGKDKDIAKPKDHDELTIPKLKLTSPKPKTRYSV